MTDNELKDMVRDRMFAVCPQTDCEKYFDCYFKYINNKNLKCPKGESK